MNVSLLSTLNQFCISTINLFFATDCYYESNPIWTLSTDEFNSLTKKEQNNFTFQVSISKALITDMFQIGDLYQLTTNIDACEIKRTNDIQIECIKETMPKGDILLYIGTTRHTWKGTVWKDKEMFSITAIEFLHNGRCKFIIMGDNNHFYSQILNSISDSMDNISI